MLTPLASKRNGQVSGPFSQIHSCPFWPVKAPRIRLASGADWFLGWHFRCCCETLCTDWVSRAARSSHWKFKKQANQKIHDKFFTLRDSSWKINNGFIFFSFENKCTRKKKRMRWGRLVFSALYYLSFSLSWDRKIKAALQHSQTWLNKSQGKHWVFRSSSEICPISLAGSSSAPWAPFQKASLLNREFFQAGRLTSAGHSKTLLQPF